MTLALALVFAIAPTTLTVGDGKDYQRIEAAVAAARPGDLIEVYPSRDGYGRTAIRISIPNLTIRGMTKGSMDFDGLVSLDGEGFDYSGAGKVPRAIIQIDPGGDGARIEHIELRGAHNESHNGAGIRINQAKNVTVDHCGIVGNDMGVMSNGIEGDPHAAENQRYSHCEIRLNGSLKDSGYSHNLYLGGTSATLEFCNILGSRAGHNLKSRAHFVLVRYCEIHDSTNRECDFVDAWDTERPNSNVVMIGNEIVKSPDCPGNREVINFGAEKGKRDGKLYLLNNTIFTPFKSGIVSLSASTALVELINNAIVNDGQTAPSLIDISNEATLRHVSGSNNWISNSYDLRPLGLTKTQAGIYQPGSSLGPSLSPGHSPAEKMTGVPAWYLDGNGRRVNGKPKCREMGLHGWQPSSDTFVGAG